MVAGVAATAGIVGWSGAGRAASGPVNGKPQPVVVELFTSEGCSSCPPADSVLARLVKEQSVKGAHIIALGEHVDYWDRNGWRDPFSSARFTARQNEYATAFKKDTVYTPQMVVDGAAEFVGSDEARAREAIARAVTAPKAEVTATLSDSGKQTLTATVDKLPGGVGEAEVFAAQVEDGLNSHVAGGENRGRHLSHSAVAHTWVSLGRVRPGAMWKQTVPLTLAGGKTARVVVLVQDTRTRHIVGATEVASFR